MSQILSGFGSPDFTALFPGTTLPKFLHVEPLDFSLEATSNKLQAMKYVGGIKTIAASKIGEFLYTLKLGIEAASWTSMQFALGELAGTTAAIALPEVRYGVVPRVSPFEVEDAGLIGAVSAQVYISDSGAWGEEGSLIVGSGPGEFGLDSTGGTLTFDAEQAGAPVAYRIIKNFTDLQSIGHEQVATLLDSMSFSGIAYSDKEYYKIIIPRMQRVSVPSLTLSDVTKLEVEFDLQTPQGFRKPFQIFKMPANYLP